MIRPGGANARGAMTHLSGNSEQMKHNKFYKITNQIAKKLNINDSIRDMGHRYHMIASSTKNQKNFKSLT